MVEEEGSFEELLEDEDAEYSRKSEFSKAAVVQSQVIKCNELRSKEMCEGHTLRLLDNQGNLKIIDIPDSRQPYVGSLIALKSNLAPEISRNKPIKEKLKIFNVKKKTIYDKYKYKEVELKELDDELKLVYSGREYIPKKGAVLIANVKKSRSSPVKEIKIEGLWDNQINAYWDDMIILYDKLFEDLNVLIDANGYFKEKSTW